MRETNVGIVVFLGEGGVNVENVESHMPKIISPCGHPFPVTLTIMVKLMALKLSMHYVKPTRHNMLQTVYNGP